MPACASPIRPHWNASRRQPGRFGWKSRPCSRWAWLIPPWPAPASASLQGILSPPSRSACVTESTFSIPGKSDASMRPALALCWIGGMSCYFRRWATHLPVKFSIFARRKSLLPQPLRSRRINFCCWGKRTAYHRGMSTSSDNSPPTRRAPCLRNAMASIRESLPTSKRLSRLAAAVLTAPTYSTGRLTVPCYSNSLPGTGLAR